jgi:hypothetical protein
MDPTALTAAVEAELQSRRVPFERRHLQEFLEETWPLSRADDTPGPALLATMFVKRVRVEEAFRRMGAEGGELYVHFLEREGG